MSAAAAVPTALPTSTLGALSAPALRAFQLLLGALTGCTQTPSPPSLRDGPLSVVSSTKSSPSDLVPNTRLVFGSVACVVVLVVLFIIRIKRGSGGGGGNRKTKGAIAGGGGQRPPGKEGVAPTGAERSRGAAGILSAVASVVETVLGSRRQQRDGGGEEGGEQEWETTNETHSPKKKRKPNKKTKLLDDINLRNNRFYLGQQSSNNFNSAAVNTEYKGKGGGSGRPKEQHQPAAPLPVTAQSLAQHAFEEFKKSHLLPQGKSPDPNLPTLVFTMGIPGCGKSTWAASYAEENPTFVIISSDAIRRELLGDVNDQTMNKLVFEIALYQCQWYLRQRRSVILDGTNVHTGARRAFLRRVITGDRPDITTTGSAGGGTQPMDAMDGPRSANGGNTKSASPHDSVDSLTWFAAPPPLSANPSPSPRTPPALVTNDSLGAVQVASNGGSCGASPSLPGTSPPPQSPLSSSGRGPLKQPAGPTRGRLSFTEVMARVEAILQGMPAAPPLGGGVAQAEAGPSISRVPNPDGDVTVVERNTIQCNRVLKVFNVTKAVAKSRISRDIQKRIDRADVPPHVIDKMSAQHQASLSDVKDEHWIPLV